MLILYSLVAGAREGGSFSGARVLPWPESVALGFRGVARLWRFNGSRRSSGGAVLAPLVVGQNSGDRGTGDHVADDGPCWYRSAATRGRPSRPGLLCKFRVGSGHGALVWGPNALRHSLYSSAETMRKRSKRFGALNMGRLQ